VVVSTADSIWDATTKRGWHAHERCWTVPSLRRAGLGGSHRSLGGGRFYRPKHMNWFIAKLIVKVICFPPFFLGQVFFLRFMDPIGIGP